ncbi:MAG: PPC domain-containing DNA-binding protein [candidate division WOR-3 bacterium]
MHLKKLKNYYVLRLQKGEEIVQTLTDFVKKTNLKGGFLYGLGVGKMLTLGYFDAHNKSYIKKQFKGDYEFTSFLGNISYFEKQPVIHIHVTITDKRFNASGGHLFSGYVPATLEIMVFPVDKKLVRKKDVDTGLNLLKI